MSIEEMTVGPVASVVQEGDLLWMPPPEFVESANLTAFTRWVEGRHGLHFDDYHALWEWSVESTADFWEAIWQYFYVRSSSTYTTPLATQEIPGTTWFPGARLNYAEHILRNEAPGETALFFASEILPLTAMSWEEFAGQVRVVATQLRGLGVGVGDRVVGYLPNIPQAVVAMVAVTSIGAIWSVCSSDFGAGGAVDRLGQLEPKVLIAVDGYRYGGKLYDRRPEVESIIAGLGNLSAVVRIPVVDVDGSAPIEGVIDWSQLLDHPAVSAAEFVFEQVPFDHPLWVLFSSGTTGLPKAIVHGHGGILLEQLKLQHLHMDLSAGDASFFYTTTGWMMWNFLASSMLLGVRPVFYDGNPAYPDVDRLWRLTDESKARLFGVSPTYVEMMDRAGVVPRERFDLSSLVCVMPAGSPVSPWCTNWFYENVKADLWVATGSGGTDCCTGLVGGVPTLPVRAGEIQAPSLGVAVSAFDDHGRSVVDQVGELVITKPMPSMPVRFWGDEDGSRYRSAYFDVFPGVWRHGDFFRINHRDGCFVLGRSDATLNRQGVRIGTAEVYKAVEAIDGVLSALVVNLDLPGGHFFMPLFVELAPGVALGEGLESQIRTRLRTEYTPRHVPDRVIAVRAIPVTRTGKKLEVPVRLFLRGAPIEEVLDPNAMADPAAMDDFVTYRDSQTDYSLS